MKLDLLLLRTWRTWPSVWPQTGCLNYLGKGHLNIGDPVGFSFPPPPRPRLASGLPSDFLVPPCPQGNPSHLPHNLPPAHLNHKPLPPSFLSYGLPGLKFAAGFCPGSCLQTWAEVRRKEKAPAVGVFTGTPQPTVCCVLPRTPSSMT